MTTTLASLTVDIAGSDSGPSAVLASLPPTTTVTSEIEVVLGTASGGYQPLTIEHLTTGDGGTLYYLSKGYGEGYCAELYSTLEAVAAAVAERWEPLTPEEIATLQLTARDVRSKVRSAVATIHQARGLHNSPIKPGTPLQAIEQYYLDAALGVTLSRSVWRHVCDLVLDVHSGGCAHHATGTTSNVREGA